MSEALLNYKNEKTNSYINFPIDSIQDIETFNYLAKLINNQDDKVIKNNMQRLANVLNNRIVDLGGNYE